MPTSESARPGPTRVTLRGSARSIRLRWSRCLTPPSCLALVLWATGGVLSAQADAPPGSHLEVSLMTIGPGDIYWERFSHNALVIRDNRAQTEIAYNWGMFDFNAEGFWPRLARGRMQYYMQGFMASRWAGQYRQTNRDVWVQTVHLTPAERLELQALLTEMDTDANRHYRYDYYRDNCSTRVRDALDDVLGGQIRVATEGTDTGTTYRWHTARLLQPVPVAYAGIQFVVGNRGDETISAWEEMFLPLRLREHLEGVRIMDAEGDPGPLLGEAVQIVEAVGRYPISLAAPDLRFPLLLLGIILGAFFAAFGWVASRGKRWGRWALALSGAAFSSAVGLLGTALLLSWFFTDHVFWTLNENVFQANPASLLLAFVLSAVLVREALNRSGEGTGDRARVWPRIRVDTVAKVAGGLAIAGLLAQVLPGFDQVNGEVIAVLLPAHVGLAWGVLQAWPPSMA